MRKSALGAAALLAVACGGLLFNQGNAFPCDFSAPEETRDQACAKGEVCGVLNRCQRYVYEGPQFEGTPELPSFDAGAKVHPLVLNGPTRLVAVNAASRDEFLAVLAIDGGLRTVRVDLGRLTLTHVLPVSFAGAQQVGVTTETFGATLSSDGVGALRLFDGGVVAAADAIAVRTGPGAEPPLRMGALRKANTNGSTAMQFDDQRRVAGFRPTGADGGTLAVLDLRWVPPSRKGSAPDGRPILLTREGFFYFERSPDGGGDFLGLSADTEETFGLGAVDKLGNPLLSGPSPGKVLLRHDLTGALWAFAHPFRDLDYPTVLSTWQLTRTGEAPRSMARAWNECTPCPNAKILAIAPNLDGLANVEVLCGNVTTSEDATLVRVVGALSADPTDPCVTQPVAPAFDLSKDTLHREGEPRGMVYDDSNGAGVVVGGQRGEVWFGPSFSRALPLFLDRVPLAVGAFYPSSGAPVLPIVVTDRYLAAPVFSTFSGGVSNGFKVFDFRNVADFVLADDVRPRALVGGAPGWGVLSSADVARVFVRPLTVDGGVVGSGNFFALSFGPRLLDARGDPAREPYQGEAVTAADGGVVSLVLTADDSVYLAPTPQELGAPNAQPPLFPVLTPEPGSPIRSFALERTRLGTDGVKRVRGYAVTSRNLFTVTLGGEPARWSATPLLLGGGEPLEVWMDNPRGGLARVGYRDGNVFSLPGGFQLVRPEAGQEPRQVLDYENLGGWPVAYATSGLWIGHYDLVNGKLDNKLSDGRPGKPMWWRRVTMADGSTPWLKPDGTARPGKLHVLVGPQVQVQPEGTYQQLFRLFLYLDDAVYEVGSMRRSNNSAPPN